MRMLRDNEGVLFLNREPCRYVWRGKEMGCDVFLGDWLPPNSRLRVIAPNNYSNEFKGDN
ncbi:MAG: hypothetical protein K8T91_08195 [Planctomycetes bacterium]|nr:hypothetical protein [Planctomycetota bacterium]